MRRFLFLLSSFSIGNPKNCKHNKYKKMAQNGKKMAQNGKKWPKMAKNNKKNKIKNTKIKIKCVVGGGGGQSSLFALLISNTLPQLEQSSLHPSTILHHRLLLQTTCYNHLRLLLHLLISSKEK